MPVKIEGARFDTVSKSELDQLGMPRPIVPAFLDEKEIEKLAQKDEAFESQARNISAARGRLKALDPRELRPEVFAQRRREIRARYHKQLGDVARAAGELAANADAARVHWTREACLRRAVFRQNPLEDAQIRSALILTLSKTPDNALLGIAQRAVNERSAALTCVLADELASRRDIGRDQRSRITRILDQVETEAERVGPKLDHLANGGRRILAITDGSPLNKIKSGVAAELQQRS